jgi:hypothetical protein
MHEWMCINLKNRETNQVGARVPARSLAYTAQVGTEAQKLEHNSMHEQRLSDRSEQIPTDFFLSLELRKPAKDLNSQAFITPYLHSIQDLAHMDPKKSNNDCYEN